MICRYILFVLFALCGGWVEAQENRNYEFLDMKSSPFEVDENYLSKHDIVYLSPTQLEAEGFPMGNGNMGGMIWNHDNGIEIQINKNDLWTDLRADEGNTAILKHAARIKIDFGTPVFSWIHLKDFEGRLSMKNGEVTYKSTSAVSDTYIRTWLASQKNIWVVECQNTVDKTLGEKSLATVSLERVGSRAFAGWYSGYFPKDVHVGVGNANSSWDGRDLILEENGAGLHFVVACRMLEKPKSAEVVNRHRSEQETDRSNFTLLISVVTDRENENPKQAAKDLLDSAEAEGIDYLRKEKDTWYKKFWSNSFVKLGDDYVENIYYLRRYLMAAGSQGEFPVAFNGGLWRWNRDVMNWVTPHHWNTQQQYWGLCAQNDCQLMLPYLNTYFKMIPFAESLAKEKGANDNALLITEAHCFNGHQDSKDRGDMKNNYTPASQIASLFWDYYDFTGDKDFLQNKAYPFMKKAANFYLDKLQWDKQKKEYFFYSSVYESASIDHVKNAITDRICIEQLFRNCIKAASVLGVDKKMISRWKYVLRHLWKIRFEQYETCGETIAPAEEYYTAERYTPWIWSNGGLVAFPANLVGIDSVHTRIGQAVINLANCRSDANAHYPIPEVAARMGLGDKALEYIVNGIKIHQMYPQGLMHNVTGYPDNIYDLNSRHDLLNHSHIIRSQAFFQCGMEPISNYATAVNEMLLQSHENKIRVFPAIPAKWDTTEVAFTLLARGGFVVSSRRDKKALVSSIGIKSLQGNICRVQNPWKTLDIQVLNVAENKNVKCKIDDKGVIIFPTEKGVEYVITNAAVPVAEHQVIYSGKANSKVKRLGNRVIGKFSGWHNPNE